MQARILIIDDDDCLRSVLQDALDYEGYAVSVADGHRSALGLLERQQFDLVLTDGIEFRPPYEMAQRQELAACQRAAGAAPVVLFTGYHEAQHLRPGGNGFAAIWLKPMSLDELLTAIGLVLDPAGADEPHSEPHSAVAARTPLQDSSAPLSLVAATKR